jgi:lon-related putative ATP-dependent protease
MRYEVPVERLRLSCDPQTLPCATSEELQPGKTIIGQQRATRSLQFGLGIQAPGFNIFVAGLPGTGRTTAVTRYLEAIAQERPAPCDWCYVNSFHDPSRPNAIRLPAGRARRFQADMSALIQAVQRELRQAFESAEYAARRAEVTGAFEARKQVFQERAVEKAVSQGFVIRRSPVGVMTLPLKDGQPMTPEEFATLSPAEQEAWSQKGKVVQAEIENAFRQCNAVDKEASVALVEMDQQVALYALRHLFDELKERYAELPEVIAYLDEVRSDLLADLDQFRPQEQQPAASPQAADAMAQRLEKYAVNVLVDSSDRAGAPVVMEHNPTYSNLFGRIDNEARFGTLVTNFTLIGAGSLHRANGGYLVLPIEDVLRNPFSWDSLKRALRDARIVVEDPMQRLGLFSTRTLQPEPIPLDVKVILIGRPMLYHMLQAFDDDFAELFKVKAEFDSIMDRQTESVEDYARFVSSLCGEEGLKHLDSVAVAKMIELGSRLAGDQQKLSTRFGEIADVIREANYYAVQESVPYVTESHVRRAIEERFYRSRLIQQRIQEMTARGILLIDVRGERIGQVNGLSVMNLGDIAFGHPCRITATVGAGREGVIDIEREAKLGDATHTKGVLILGGYLVEKYGRDKPLGLAARLVFEQSYSGVAGDSASSSELYALLSALSGLPIRQGIAVTGSVNQKGEVQAIGGVNEKIEGFFEVCRSRGLTGDQGVLIPASNEQHLMLKEEVVEAVGAGKFHIRAVSTVDEGIEILTGVKAGARREDGTFEEGTVNARVAARMAELTETLGQLGGKEGTRPQGSTPGET